MSEQKRGKAAEEVIMEIAEAVGQGGEFPGELFYASVKGKMPEKALRRKNSVRLDFSRRERRQAFLRKRNEKRAHFAARRSGRVKKKDGIPPSCALRDSPKEEVGK